jgi:hypothetical protein
MTSSSAARTRLIAEFYEKNCAKPALEARLSLETCSGGQDHNWPFVSSLEAATLLDQECTNVNKYADRI